MRCRCTHWISHLPALLVPADDAAVMSLALEVSYSDPDGDSGGVELRVCSAAAGAGDPAS